MLVLPCSTSGYSFGALLLMSADSLLTNWSPGSSLVWPMSASLLPDAGALLIARFCWFALVWSCSRLALSAKGCCFLTCGFLRTAFFTTGLMLFALVAKSLLLFFKTALFSCCGVPATALWQIFVAEDDAPPVVVSALTPRQIESPTLQIFQFTPFLF